jgi:hypothetical protein
MLIGSPNVKITPQPGDLIQPCGCMLVTRMGPLGPIVTLVPHDINCEVVKMSIDYAIAEEKDVALTKGVNGS